MHNNVKSLEDNPGSLLFEANQLIKRAIDIRSARGDSILEFVSLPILVGWVKGELASRRDRTKHFGTMFLAEPAWDAFMVLFVADFEGWNTSSEKMAEMIGASDRTMEMHLRMLASMNIVRWDEDQHPTITNQARESLIRYLTLRFNHMTEPPDPREYLATSSPV